MKMKDARKILFLMLPLLLVVFGCKNIGFLSRGDNANNSSGNQTREESRRKIEENKRKNREREPIALTAKMVEDFPAPADAEVVADEEEKPAWVKKQIKLKSAAAVYDISHFYRQEMVKNGWQEDERNDRETNAREILSFLTFTKENESVDVDISSGGKDVSEIEIQVREENNRASRLKNPVPMPPCAKGSNTISNQSGMTINSDCDEKVSPVAKFYAEELPKNGWKLENQSGDPSGDNVTMTFTKVDQRAIIALVYDGSTSINIRISKRKN